MSSKSALYGNEDMSSASTSQATIVYCHMHSNTVVCRLLNDINATPDFTLHDPDFPQFYPSVLQQSGGWSRIVSDSVMC